MKPKRSPLYIVPRKPAPPEPASCRSLAVDILTVIISVLGLLTALTFLLTLH